MRRSPAARAAWDEAHVGRPLADGLEGGPLAVLNSAMGSLRRHVEAVHAQVAADVARASRAELGKAGLAKQQGYRNPALMIAAAAGTGVGDAARLLAVGEATAPRMTLSGAEAPPKHPVVASALSSGRLSVASSAAIVALLDRVAFRTDAETLREAERVLVAQAEGLSNGQLCKILVRAEAWLDPDGVEPREADLRVAAYARVNEDGSGMIVIDAKLDPERGAPVKTVLDAMVGVMLNRLDDNAVNRSVDSGGRRPIPELLADALATICRHALECDATDVPTGGATVIVPSLWISSSPAEATRSSTASISRSRSRPSGGWRPMHR